MKEREGQNSYGPGKIPCRICQTGNFLASVGCLPSMRGSISAKSTPNAMTKNFNRKMNSRKGTRYFAYRELTMRRFAIYRNFKFAHLTVTLHYTSPYNFPCGVCDKPQSHLLLATRLGCPMGPGGRTKNGLTAVLQQAKTKVRKSSASQP